MIIDAHTHVGKAFWGDFSPEMLLNIVDNNADFLICSNLAGIDWYTQKNELDANLEMLEASKKYIKIKPLLICQVERTSSCEIVEKLIKENPEFIGLKFHPEFTKLPANSDKYDKYLELARKYNKPCLFHSDNINSKYASPKLIYEKAQQFPNVPIILGHLSMGDINSKSEAIKLMVDSIENNKAKLYVDTSWLELDEIILLIDSLKNTSRGDFTNRILWATDTPVGEINQNKNYYQDRLSNFKQIILNNYNDKNLLENILFNNAKKLFKLKV